MGKPLGKRVSWDDNIKQFVIGIYYEEETGSGMCSMALLGLSGVEPQR
jgi:hypothetical protein